METSFKLKFISFKHLALFFSLLLSFQLQFHHLLILSLPQNSMVAAADLENNFGRESKVKIGGEHETKAVGSGGGGGGGGGGKQGIVSGPGGAGGTTKSTNRGGGALIPVYAAGSAAAKRNRNGHHRGSSGGTNNCIGWSRLILILFTSFFFVYSL